jgi:hypothetical protein
METRRGEATRQNRNSPRTRLAVKKINSPRGEARRGGVTRRVTDLWYETDNVSDEYDTDDDELERYLCKRLNLTNLTDRQWRI